MKVYLLVRKDESNKIIHTSNTCFTSYNRGLQEVQAYNIMDTVENWCLHEVEVNSSDAD